MAKDAKGHGSEKRGAYAVAEQHHISTDHLRGHDLPKHLGEAARMDKQSEATKNYQIVNVNVSAVNEAWKKDPDFYVKGDAIPGSKYNRARAFISSQPKEFNLPILGVNEHGMGFEDGRHRFAALRDFGYKRIPVSMDHRSIKRAREKGFLS